MKQILTMLRLDKCLIFRDKLAVYIILAPIVMSFLIMVVLTVLEDSNICITITADVPVSVRKQISQYADVELVENLSELEKRINEFDNMAGLTWENDGPRVLFQGNEGAGYTETILYMVDTAINTSLPIFTTKNLATGRNMVMQIIICVLLTAPAAIGGIVSGFNIVTEKETLVSKVYRISPLPTSKFLVARYIVSALVGLINLIGIALILGVGAKLPVILLLATVFALPLFAWSPTLIGGIAKDKMGSLSMVKIIMLVFICLPIGAAMAPARFQFFFYPFPMYWHYKTIESVLYDNFNLMYAVLTFLLSGGILLILTKMFKKRLQSV